MASLAAETQGVGMFEYVEINKDVSEHVTVLIFTLTTKTTVTCRLVFAIEACDFCLIDSEFIFCNKHNYCQDTVNYSVGQGLAFHKGMPLR
jgi:hypothetical protein